MEKKDILLITYYFPPQQTPRAFRWEMLVNFIINKGFQIDILLPKYNSMPRPKLKNVKYYETRQGISDNIFYKKFFKRKPHEICSKINNYNSPKIKNLFKKFCSILFNILAWPDYSIIWYLFAKKELKRMIKNNHYNYIISSAFPFTSHLLGYYAKMHLKVLWIAEYGDPFSFNPNVQRSVFRFLNRRIEEKLLKKMDYIVVPFEGAKAGFLSHFPFLEKNSVKVIPQNIPLVKANPGKIKWNNFNKDKINIVYTGSFYKSIRNPKILLEALIKLREKDVYAYQKLRFHIFGPLGNTINELFNEYQLLVKERILILYGKISRESCAFACKKADYLLNIANISKYQLPSKLFDYLHYRKPIISLENEKSVAPDWKFLIEVNYQVDDLIDKFIEISKNNIKISFSDYNSVIQKYNINKIVNQYLKLFSM